MTVASATPGASRVPKALATGKLDSGWMSPSAILTDLGLTGLAAGALIFATGAETVDKLTLGGAGQLLIAAASAPAWSGTGLTYASGVLTVVGSVPASVLSGESKIGGGVARHGTAVYTGTLSASGQITSTVAAGTAPFVVASQTVVANLNASLLLGQTWANPGAIGGTTPAAVSCTMLTASGTASNSFAVSTSTSGRYGIIGTYTVPSPAAGGVYRPISSTFDDQGTGTATWYNEGNYFAINITGSGSNAGYDRAFTIDATHRGNGTRADLTGVFAQCSTYTGTTGTVTLMRSFRLKNVKSGAGSTITTGVLLDLDANAGNTQYAIRSLSTSGIVSIGDTTEASAGAGSVVLAGGLYTAKKIITATGVECATLTATGTGGVGYATGAGGAVEQATGRTTGVTLNKICGSITLVSAAGSTSAFSFTVTNSTVAATDTVRVCQKSGTDKYIILVTAVAAGSFEITAYTTGGTTTEQPVFNFAVIKAVVT